MLAYVSTCTKGINLYLSGAYHMPLKWFTMLAFRSHTGIDICARKIY